MLLFGRAICPDKSRCDDVNPSVAVMAVSENTECVDNGGAVPDTSPYDDTETAGHHLRQSVMYYGGEAYAWTSHVQITPPVIPLGPANDFPEIALQSQTGSSLLSPFNASADVIPIFSHALKFTNNDASLFFFTRDSTGNISHGYWEGQTDPITKGISGSRDYTIFSSGAYTN